MPSGVMSMTKSLSKKRGRGRELNLEEYPHLVKIVVAAIKSSNIDRTGLHGEPEPPLKIAKQMYKKLKEAHNWDEKLGDFKIVNIFKKICDEYSKVNPDIDSILKIEFKAGDKQKFEQEIDRYLEQFKNEEGNKHSQTREIEEKYGVTIHLFVTETSLYRELSEKINAAIIDEPHKHVLVHFGNTLRKCAENYAPNREVNEALRAAPSRPQADPGGEPGSRPSQPGFAPFMPCCGNPSTIFSADEENFNSNWQESSNAIALLFNKKLSMDARSLRINFPLVFNYERSMQDIEISGIKKYYSRCSSYGQFQNANPHTILFSCSSLKGTFWNFYLKANGFQAPEDSRECFGFFYDESFQRIEKITGPDSGQEMDLAAQWYARILGYSPTDLERESKAYRDLDKPNGLGCCCVVTRIDKAESLHLHLHNKYINNLFLTTEVFARLLEITAKKNRQP